MSSIDGLQWFILKLNIWIYEEMDLQKSISIYMSCSVDHVISELNYSPQDARIY